MTQHSKPSETPAEIVSRVRELATLPDVYVRVKKVLDNPASSHEAVAEAIETDPAMSARLLKIANSAFYGRPGSIATVSRAVGLLGTQQVHDLVLSTVVIQAFGDINQGFVTAREFWHNSLLAACGAKILAEQCQILDSERLFVAGLLAQVGQLILYQELPDQMRVIMLGVQKKTGDIRTLQHEHLGFDYAEISAQLFSAWQLPPALVEPIRYHTHPTVAEDTLLEASIVHIAVQLADTKNRGNTLEQLLTGLDDHAWQATGISREQLEQLRVDASALTDEIAPALLDIAA